MLENIEVEKIDTFQIISKHSDFNKENYSWQEAYFQVMAFQNTFDFAYSTNIESTHDHEAYLLIILRPETGKDRIVEWLEGLGYRNLIVNDVTVGEIQTYDLGVDYITEV